MSKPQLKTTYEAAKVIQPIYTGGGVSVDHHARILATSVGEDAMLTNLSTGEKLASIEGDGESITLTPSASHIVLCSRSLSMRIFSLDSSSISTAGIIPRLERTLKPHSSPVIVTTIDRTGTLLATGGADNVVKVWDIRGGYVTHTFRGHQGVISALHFFELADSMDPGLGSISDRNRKRNGPALSSSGEDSRISRFRLASGSEDGKVRIWDLSRRKCAATLESHVSIVRALDYLAEEGILLSAGRDKTVSLWDSRSWKLRKVIPVLESLESAGFSKDGVAIFTGGEHGKVRVWERESGREITQEQAAAGEGEHIVEIIPLIQSDFVISVHGDHSLVFHSLEPLAEVNGHASLPALPIIRRIYGTHDEVIDLAFLASDHGLMALATNSEDVRIIAVSESESGSDADREYFGADVGLLKGHQDIVICLDVDWSGNWLVTGAKDNSAKLWRIDGSKRSFTCHATFTGHAESLGAIALPREAPPTGSSAHAAPLEHPPPFVISGSQDRTIKRWDVKRSSKAPRALYTRKAHDKDINSIDINHNSTLFASASQDRNVKIWSVEEGEVQGILRGHRRGVWSVKFAPKETPAITSERGLSSSNRGLILTGSADKTVKIWGLSDYSCLMTLEGHTNSVLKILWLPLRKTEASSQPLAAQVASAGGDGLVKVWDLSTSDAACTLDNHTDRVWALSSNTQSQTLVSGGADGVITFWHDTSEATAAAQVAATSKRIEREQELDNLTRSGAWREAIVLALSLNHPARLLSLFTSVANTTDPAESESVSGVRAVDEALATLSPGQLLRLLMRLRDWNTNARTAPVAQRILRVIFLRYSTEDLTRLVEAGIDDEDEDGGEEEEGGDEDEEMVQDWDGTGGHTATRRNGQKQSQIKKRKKKSQALLTTLTALRAYTERHYARLLELIEESYVVDYTLREMGLGMEKEVGVEDA